MPSIKKVLYSERGLSLKRDKIWREITQNMGLVWRKVGSSKAYVNSNINILKRQEFSAMMASIFEQKKVIINFDECTFCSTTSK